MKHAGERRDTKLIGGSGSDVQTNGVAKGSKPALGRILLSTSKPTVDQVRSEPLSCTLYSSDVGEQATFTVDYSVYIANLFLTHTPKT
ncbi:hypothetical protein [uncultured Fibrella sp.]|uniref:hypothetical protein n=1 Tax=uncultured Fibrella sp. TaxID=1284596 RepID=UPI0035CA0329